MTAKARRRDRARTHRVSPLPGILRRMTDILDTIRATYPRTLPGGLQYQIKRDLTKIEATLSTLCDVVAEDVICRPPGSRDDRREDAFVA